MKTTGMIAKFAFAAALALVIPGCSSSAKDPATQPSTAGSATAEAESTGEAAASESSSEATTQTETADTSAEQQSSAGYAVNQYCAVHQQHPADPKVTYTHEGTTFAFCSEDCVETFKQEPYQYTDAR